MRNENGKGMSWIYFDGIWIFPPLNTEMNYEYIENISGR